MLSRRYKKAVQTPALLKPIVILAVLGVLSKYCSVEGFSKTSAALGSLVSLIEFPLTLLIASTLFEDERRVTKTLQFKAGVLICFLGTAGVAIGGKDFNLTYCEGVGYLVMASIFSCAYGLLTKRLVMNLSPFSLCAVNAVVQCIIFFIWVIFLGNMGTLLNSSAFTLFILFGSGAYGVLIGMGLGFVIVKRLGIIIFHITMIMVPLLTLVVEHILLNELFSVVQMFFGTILILGCSLVLNDLRQPKK